MSLRNQPGEDVPASQRRVKTAELAKAIAAIEARRAEQARALEGTVLIGQAVQEMSLDYSPEQIWAEVQARRVRKESVQACAPVGETEQPPEDAPVQGWESTPGDVYPDFLPEQLSDDRQMPKAGALGAVVGLLSLGLCGLAVMEHSPTNYRTYPTYGTSWTVPPMRMYPPPPGIMPPVPISVSEPDAAFYHKLKLSRGPHPVYHLVAWPIPGVVAGGGDIDWKHLTAYPMRAVPDSYNIHVGITLPTGPYREDADATWRVAFARADDRLIGDWAYTRYHGIHYLRARVATADIPGMGQHHAFRVFTDFPLTREAERLAGANGLTDLTLPLMQTWAEHARGEEPDGRTFFLQFPDGQQTPLDKHAWETW